MIKRKYHQFPTWYCPCGFVASSMTFESLGLLYKAHVEAKHCPI